MKKILLFGCLVFITACSQATPTPAPIPTLSATLPPSPSPESATQTLIPSPTFSPTPPSKYFIDSFDEFSPYWDVISINSEARAGQVQLNNGYLILNPLAANTWIYAIHNAHTYENVQINATFQINDGAPYMIGLICHYDKSAGWFEYDLLSDGSYSVLFGQWLADGVVQYTPIAHDTNEYIRIASQYGLGLGCIDGFLWLYINGKLFRKVDVLHYGLTNGEVGMTTSSFEDPNVTVGVDSVEVKEP